MLMFQKHYEDKSKKAAHPPANQSATVHGTVEVLTCPRPATPPPKPKPKPAPAPPPAVVMRKKRTPPPAPPPVTVFDEVSKDVDGDNSKWAWMRWAWLGSKHNVV